MSRKFDPEMRLKGLQMKDASSLRHNGIVTGNRSEVEDKVRAMLSDGMSRSYVMREDESVIALARITTNPYGESAMLDICQKDDDLPVFASCLKDLMRIAFRKLQMHKISIVVSVSDKEKERLITEFGFSQEAVLHDEIRTVSSYEDAGLFYMTAASYRGYSLCFVPFVKGILAVYGGQDFIDKVEFINYGSEPSGFLAAEKARYYCLLDGDGKFLPRGDSGYEFTGEEIDEMPYELGRAYTEFKEYFLKTRVEFDLNLRITDATDFQRKVWDSLKTIPYGSTMSYEDIALMLTGNDIKEARKLSRAVGNACSENPLPIVIPCHRVIGKNGMLVGFSGGIEFKDYLLQNEMFPGVLSLG